MEQTQQSPKNAVTEAMAQEPVVEQRERPRRLRIDLLEERVAPNAIWGE
jgi:hypothetical protein